MRSIRGSFHKIKTLLLAAVVLASVAIIPVAAPASAYTWNCSGSDELAVTVFTGQGLSGGNATYCFDTATFANGHSETWSFAPGYPNTMESLTVINRAINMRWFCLRFKDSFAPIRTNVMGFYSTNIDAVPGMDNSGRFEIPNVVDTMTVSRHDDGNCP